jgi:hypothetical protein
LEKLRYKPDTAQRILNKLNEAPPEGRSLWTGSLLAQALGDVSEGKVWRVFRQQKISLSRRKSWCVSTDPEFVPKAADIVGLYLNPPQNAVVLCIDEKPCIQALERAQGWIRLPNGRALSGFSHEYTRHGTTTLFAALEGRDRSGQSQSIQAAATAGVFGFHESDRGNLPPAGYSRYPGQFEHAQTQARPMAGAASECAFSFYPHPRLLGSIKSKSGSAY